MITLRRFQQAFVLAGLAWLAASMAPAAPQKAKLQPSLEPVADTHLLMEGLNLPNFRALEKLLKQKPADADSWTFARGQALLIAETGNLLLLRPPRNAGQDAWFRDAMDLRDAAADLARKVGDRDYDGSLAGMKTIAAACNSCHQTFRVQ